MARIIDFPMDRINIPGDKTKAKPKDKSLNGSMSRHPSKVAPKKPSTASENAFINLSDVLAKGMLDTNTEEVAYHLDRLDVILTHFTSKLNPEELAMMTRDLTKAMATLSELSYNEGLAEGYFAGDEDRESLSPANEGNLGDPDF